MNRRNFFKALGIGAAALYLRIAPNLTKAVPHVEETTKPTTEQFVDMNNWEFPVHDNGWRGVGQMHFDPEMKKLPLYLELR